MQRIKPDCIKIIGHKEGKPKYKVWLVGLYKCRCGIEFKAYVSNVNSGNTTSCGCFRRGLKRGTQNKTDSKVYRAWQSMKRRCLYKKDIQYMNYGGRGITIDEKWRISFESFFNDMGEPPSKRHSLDRIDVNGNYNKENCKWSTVEEQHNNKTTSVKYFVIGAFYSARELSEVSGINAECIRRRVNRDWSIERAISEQPSKTRGGFRNVK